MADKKTENLIDARTADKLIAAHDGEVALYCLYALRHPGEDDETAAAALCRTRAEIAAAREKLERILRDTAKGAEEKILFPDESPVQYSKEELVKIAGREGAFTTLREELTRILGTIPSQAYLNMLVDVYDHLGMPPEVILVLLHYCDGETRRRWGSTRRPSAKFISDEAYAWARREIMTLDLADEYIAAREKQRGENSRVAALLGIRGRDLSPTETKYIDAWLEMGFTDEAICAALDRTLTNTGSLKWPYMNAILRKWHAAGLHDAEAIEKAEGSRKGRAARGNGHGDPVDDTELEEFMGEKR